MANKDDYLVDYSKFFKNFAETLNPNDPLPVKLGSYKLLNTEVIGGVIDWTTQYLHQKNCPESLIAPLINITIRKTREKCKHDPRACGFNVSDSAYEPLKLMQSVVARCNEICSLYLDNSLLCSLPPPNGHYHRHPVSVCAVKNGRRRMEDRHVVINDLNTILNLHEDVTPSSYYAVFDGHAGHDAAVYSALHLHQYLGESEHFPSNPEKALTEAFHKTDACFVQKCEPESGVFSLEGGGTTAVCALLRPQEKYLYVAWVGDSMALIANKGRILQCVVPHKPGRKDEQDRIEKAGGTVVFWGTWRVNGQLAVSRAIGDADFKPSVIATPDIQRVALDGCEDFIILACDGLWDFVDDDLAAKEVYTTICRNPEDAEVISEVLVKLAKARGSNDNISIIVVFLRDPHDVAADAQWLLEANISEGTTSQRDQDSAAAAPPLSIAEAVSEAIRAAAAMDAAAGLDNKASNPFANNDAATTGEHVQKDPFLLDLDSLKQQATDISSVPNNDFFLGVEHSTNGKRSAEEVFDDDDFGPETNVDGEVDNLQPQDHFNDKNSFQPLNFDEKMEADKENDQDHQQFHEDETDQRHQDEQKLYDNDDDDDDNITMSPILLAAKAIAEGVDNINNANPDRLLSRLEEEMDLAMEREFNNGGNEFAGDEFHDNKVTEEEDVINSKLPDDVHDGNLVDNVADSGEESEDEWNYFKGNTAADTDKENIDPTTKQITIDILEGDDIDMSQLNPNAAEFVPVSPTRTTTSPPCMGLINDPILAQSPKRIPRDAIDIDVPEANDFETEIRNRPSDVFNKNNGHAEADVKPIQNSTPEDMENRLNDRNVEDSDFQTTKSAENFHFGPNATPFSTPAKFLDDSEAFSTKATFGDESTATYLDTTCNFSPDKNQFADENNLSGDQTDFQAIMNKESDPMSMSFYQDKDEKSDTNPFDLNKVQMLPDDLDDFLATSDVKSDLPEPDQQQQIITDLDKPAQDEELLGGTRELPKSPIEDIKTPEPTFDENLCPNNEVIEKEDTEYVSEKIDTRNMSTEINELCGQIKDMAMDDTSFTESEIEFNQPKLEQSALIPEQSEEEHFLEELQQNIENPFFEPQQEEPQLCVMKLREDSSVECHIMTPSQYEDQTYPEPINQEVPIPEGVHEMKQEFSPDLFESRQTFATENQPTNLPLLSPEIEQVHQEPQLLEQDLIETPVDDITSSIKDDVSPVQLAPPVDLIPDLPIEEPTVPKAAIAVAAGAAAVATITAAVSKKAGKETPQKKTATVKSAATPKPASRGTATTPKGGATSPTKSASKPSSATKAPTPRTTASASGGKPSSATTGKVSAPSPRPKTTAAVPAKTSTAKPLVNGDLKSSAPKPRALPLTKLTATSLSPKPTTAVRSPTKPATAKPMGATRPFTAPAALKTNAPAKPAAVGKPKPTATSVARATSATSKVSSTATSATKTLSTATKLTASTLTSTNKSTVNSKTSTAAPPKPRVPISRTVPPKAPDAEKQNKENVNKQTASRTAASSARSTALTNGKTATTMRKIEPKVAGLTSKMTVTKTTTSTTTRQMVIKKPIATDTNRPITKPTTKTVTKITKSAAANINGLPNGISETTTTLTEHNGLINVADNNTVDLVVLKDNSPIMENSQMINATAAD